MPYSTDINFAQVATSDDITQNPTFVSPSGFRLLIDNQKYKNAQYTVQTVSLPDMSVGTVPLNTPQRNISMLPDKVEYGVFDMTFLIDENLINYKEIHDWILGLVTQKDENTRKVRDVSLIILDSHNNPAREIKFVDAFPLSLGSLPFDAATGDVEYLVGTVSFQYNYFKIL